MPSPSSTEPFSLVQRMHRPWREVPLTVTLIALNTLVFALMAARGGSALHLAPGLALQWGANFGPATQSGEWWRLASALFVHLSVLHLAVNMWALWDIGRLMEGLLGRWRLALLYGSAGVAGNVLSLALQDQPRVSGGASGALFGLYGALLAFMWRERSRIAPDEYRWMSRVALGFCGLTLGLGFFVAGIDNAAHGGGLLAGLVLGGLLRHAAPGLRTPLQPPWGVATGVLSAVALLAVWAGLAQPPYRYSDELQARSAMQQFVQDDRNLSARWQTLVQPGSGQTFEEMAGALQTEVVDPYQRSFEALAAVDTLGNVPSRAALLQLQTYAQRRHAQALQAAQALLNNAKDPTQP